MLPTLTPNSSLAKELRKRQLELNKMGNERIQMIERGGIKFENLLTKKNPFKNESCGENCCPSCKILMKIPCNTNNIGYQWICKICQGRQISKVYEGESSRPGYGKKNIWWIIKRRKVIV